MLARDERTWASRRLRFDLTVPTVSVSAGPARPRASSTTSFGIAAIEDFRLQFFCTSTNLSRFRARRPPPGSGGPVGAGQRQRPGPVAAAWSTTTANCTSTAASSTTCRPTSMRAHHAGPIIAVDVCAIQRTMSVPAGVEPPIGLRHLLRRRASVVFPSLVDTINRCALLGSLQHQRAAAAHADVYLTPDLGPIGFSGVRRIHEAVDIGYRTAMESLAGWSPGASQDRPAIARSPASWTGPRSPVVAPPPAATETALS